MVIQTRIEAAATLRAVAASQASGWSETSNSVEMTSRSVVEHSKVMEEPAEWPSPTEPTMTIMTLVSPSNAVTESYEEMVLSYPPTAPKFILVSVVNTIGGYFII